jgi:hypothetical protein
MVKVHSVGRGNELVIPNVEADMSKNTSPRPRATRPPAKAEPSKASIRTAKVITRDDLRRDTYTTRESGSVARSA